MASVRGTNLLADTGLTVIVVTADTALVDDGAVDLEWSILAFEAGGVALAIVVGGTVGATGLELTAGMRTGAVAGVCVGTEVGETTETTALTSFDGVGFAPCGAGEV